MKGQGVLAAIPGDEYSRLPLGNLSEQAGRIAVEALDLDHASTTLGKQLRTERHGYKLTKLYYLDTLERLLLILHLTNPAMVPLLYLWGSAYPADQLAK
jgi:hypothetical protein